MIFSLLSSQLRNNLAFDQLKKNNKKIEACVVHCPTSARGLLFSGIACGASQHPKIPFYFVIASLAVSSSWWCGACQQCLYGLSLVGLSYSLILFVFDISTLVYVLLISIFCS
jgi:hypothetical protein